MLASALHIRKRYVYNNAATRNSPTGDDGLRNGYGIFIERRQTLKREWLATDSRGSGSERGLNGQRRFGIPLTASGRAEVCCVHSAIGGNRAEYLGRKKSA